MFVLPGLKSSLVYIIFQTPMQSLWSHLLPMHCTWTHLLSSMPPMLLTRHFHWGNTCVLLILGNRCISRYTMLPTQDNNKNLKPSFLCLHTTTDLKIIQNQYLANSYIPVSWDCRICQKYLCRQVKTLPVSVQGMTQNHLIVGLQSWSFGEYGVTLHCHQSQTGRTS